MTAIVPNLWLIPALPTAAAGISALLKQRARRLAASLAIGAMALSFLLSVWAFCAALGNREIQVFNFRWLEFGDQWLKLGWMLDPLTAVMLVMVTFVGLLIFIYSIGYMEHDENFARFFCFLSLFAGAMLGVVIANSLLLLFMCWEIVGLTSYLLIGFWYANPKAAAAAKKAFLTTRIGDMGFLIGIVWLYSQTGTLLFHDAGAGCLEQGAIAHLIAQTTVLGLTMSSAIGILIFCGAAGKSGQVPLHVWLPDAMEGPTPVSALIHAATMVAAGVFLIARIYPLMAAQHAGTFGPSAALQVVAWVGAITALFGATIAVAQFDIKRILAYSTVSQLGYMMMGLGVGGVATGMFHLITHAFFKSLLFLGAGSLIHGCSGEQDIRRLGGLKKYMPITFAAYAVGMLALCGFPLFSGFWSKDAILHAAHTWGISQAPFAMGMIGALLTAFYMTRQMYYVFAGQNRLTPSSHGTTPAAGFEDQAHHPGHLPHESPAVMTVPLMILAACAMLLGFLGTPAWPWFQSFLEGGSHPLRLGALFSSDVLTVMLASSLLVFVGLGLGWYLYGRASIRSAEAPDALESLQPAVFSLLGHAYFVDRLYAATVVRLTVLCARLADWADRIVWNGVVQIVSYMAVGLGSIDNFFDAGVINGAFDGGCESVSRGGALLSLFQGGRIQAYLKVIGLALMFLVIFLLWGAKT
jgi:NADH-quinone oxidoreductase subunit L